MAVIKMLEFDPGTLEYGCYQASATATIVPGFVHMISTNYKLVNTLASGAVSPVGVVLASYASGSTGVTLRTDGLVWMTLTALMKASAGQPVFPGTKGCVQVTGATNVIAGSATKAVYKLGTRGFGTVVVGGASGTDILVKLERM